MRRTPTGRHDGRLRRRLRLAIQRLEARELLTVSLIDGGFESPAQGDGNFIHDPSGSAWTFTGGAGLTGNDSAFATGGQNAPQGQQAAMIQQTGTISQDVPGWDAGAYHITFAASLRYGSAPNDFQVLVDNAVVGTFQPQTGANYLYYTTPAFDVAAGDHTVTFRALDTQGGDNTVLIDASAITPATDGVPVVNDPSFELAPVPDGGYAYDPQDSYWDFGGSAGVSGDNSGFTGANPDAPDGSHVAFLQGQGSLIQSVTDWSSATYEVSFLAAQRGSAAEHSQQNFEVLLDGKVVATFTPSSSDYQDYSTPDFAVSAGTHALTFVGLDTAGGDNTAFLDDVLVAPVRSSESIATGMADATSYDGGFVAIPSSVQSLDDLSTYLASHPIIADPTFDAQFTPVQAANGAWMPDGPDSDWIAPTAYGASTPALAPYIDTADGYDANDGSPQGLFYYTTRFFVPTGSIPGVVDGRWATDNIGSALFLNGVDQGQAARNGFSAYSPFSLNPNDFHVGMNTLTFVVFNEAFGPAHTTPTGLRVEGTIALARPSAATTTGHSLSGRVFDDANDDGKVEPGEPGQAGARVTLSGTDSQGEPIAATTTTGADGSYSFAGLAPGIYSVAEVHPAGTLDGQADVGNLGGTARAGMIAGVLIGDRDGSGYNFGLDRPPTFVTAAPTEVAPGNTYVYQPTATDPDQDTLTYTLLAGPADARFVPATRQLTWTPTSSDANNQSVALRVDDGRGGVAEQDYTLRIVSTPNRPPIFTSVPVVDAYVGAPYSYQATAFDPDMDPLTFAPASALPAGMAFSAAAAGLIGWTPTPDELGPHPVQIQVSDGRGGTATQSYTVVVRQPQGHLPPVFVSAPVTTYREPDTSDRPSVDLTATIHDFLFDGVNFEGPTGDINALKTGIVQPILGPDRTPLYGGDSAPGGVSSAAAFATFYHDVEGLNEATQYALDLDETSPGSGIYTYSSSSFFPIDNQLLGNQNEPHNYSFTMEVHSQFTYRGGEQLSFTGDDDVWVFINNRLAIDLGGVHNPLSASVSLDNIASQFGMVKGGSYPFDLFYDERHTVGSDFAMTTGLQLTDASPYGYQAEAISPEDSPLTYSLDADPAGMRIDPSTGAISWAPGTLPSGSYPVTVRATDADGAYALQPYTVMVNSAQDHQPPTFTTSPPLRVDQGETYEYDANAVDPDGDPMVYDLGSHPYGMSIDRYTGRITWTPTHQDLGTDPLVQVIASDGRGDTKAQSWNIKAVELEDQDPTVAAIPDQAVPPGATFAYQVAASDPDQDLLAYSLPEAPAGMVIDPVRGLIEWTPTPDQAAAGPQDVLVAVDDRHGGVACTSFTIVVGAIDHPPVITSTPGAAVAGVPYAANLSATDPDGDATTFHLYGSIPAGLGVVGGQLVWDDPVYVPGGYPLTLVADDGKGGISAPLPFTLRVDSDPDALPPQITSDYRTSIQLGRTYYYQVRAEDPADYPLSFAYANTQSDPGAFSITLAGLLAWTPTALGNYSFDVQASNNLTAPADQQVDVAVVPQLSNNDPTIATTSLPAATADTSYAFALQGDDVDHDPLAWTLDTGPDGMALDPTSGLLIWTPTAAQIGADALTVRLLDAQGGSATRSFTIDVRGQNLPPQFLPDYPPPATAGVAYSYQVQAYDPEGGKLSYQLAAAGGGALPVGLTINQQSGQITWPDPGGGPYNLQVAVTDDQMATAIGSFTLAVLAQAPAVPPSIDGDGLGRHAVADLPYQAVVVATAPNQDPVDFTVTPVPGNPSMSIAGGTISWTPTDAQAGTTVAVTVRATDRVTGQFTDLSYRVAVSATDHAPKEVPIAPLTIVENAPFVYVAQATDQDGDLPRWTITPSTAPDFPVGVGVASDTGQIDWAGDSTPGQYHFTLVATDPYGLTDTQVVALDVVPDVTKPTVQILTDPQSPVAVGQQVRIVVQATDDAGVASRTLTINGKSFVLDSAYSTLWTVTEPGPIDLEATATDVNGNTSPAQANLQAFAASTSAPVATFIAYKDPLGTTPPQAFKPPTTVTAPVDIYGTVGSGPNGTDPVSYTLEVVPVNGGAAQVIKSVDRTDAIADGVLGRFDPTMLADGSYILRLTSNNGSQTTSNEEVVDVTGRLKLGNLHLSFTDLTIPVAGIPITITRSYDTLNASRQGDFGYGWTLDEGDFQLQESQPDGTLTGLDVRTPFTVGTHIVITRPGMDPEGFTFEPKPSVSGSDIFSIGTGYYTPYFQPDPGVTDKIVMSSDSDGTLIYDPESGDFLSTLDYGTAYNPADPTFGQNGQLTLQTRQDTDYVIDADTGKLASVTDANGNTLTYDDSGIYSSTGREVQFKRDDEGRITEIIDPRNNIISYNYDPTTGDLISVADRAANAYAAANKTAAVVTTFFYNPDLTHFLDHVVDPFGQIVAQAAYNTTDDDRLAGLTDATGDKTTTAYDINNLSESVTAPAVGGVTPQPSTIKFDSYGNPIGATDAFGHSTSASYVATGTSTQPTELASQSQVVGGVTETTSYTYNDDGTVKSSEDADQQTTYYGYSGDVLGLPTSITDPLAHTTIIGYDTKGNTTSTTSPGGITTSTKYYPDGQVQSSTTPDGTTQYTYDPYGDVLTSTDARGVKTTYSYDDDGNQTGSSWTYTDPTSGASMLMTTEDDYDAADRLVRSVGADGTITDTVYDGDGRAVWVDDPHLAGQVHITGTETFYDADGRVIRTEQFHDVVITVATLDGETTSSFSSAGAPISVSSKIYDARGQAVWSDDSHVPGQTADGTHTDYNDDGTVAGTERYQGVDIELTTDHLSTELVVAGTPISSSSTKYDDAGRVQTSTSNGHAVTYGYDDDGHQTSAKDTVTIMGPNGPTTFTRTTTSTYDPAGHLQTSTDALGNETIYTDDADGRTIKTTYADGTYSTTAYEATTGRKTSETDQDGRTTGYSYYKNGDLQTVTLPAVPDPANPTGPAVSPIYSYKYDTYGNLQYQTDPLSDTTVYATDALGRRTSETVPDTPTTPHNNSESSTYNALGQLEYSTDFDGQVVAYTYDDQGRVLTQDDYAKLADAEAQQGAVKTVTYAYDGYDNATQRSYSSVTVDDPSAFNYTGPAITTSYTNAEGQLVEVDTPDGNKVSYEYDAVTGQKSRTFTGSSGSPTTDIYYTYDDAGRLATVKVVALDGVKLTNPLLTRYYYDLDDNLVETDNANGTFEFRTYDPLNRLTAVETVTADRAKVLSGFSYQLDAAGQRMAMVDDSGRPIAVALTAAGQAMLNLGGSAGRTVAYSYDPDGRLTRETVTNDPASPSGELTVYAYDLAGNRTSKVIYNSSTQPSSQGEATLYLTRSTDTYRYDADDRLVDDDYVVGGNYDGGSSGATAGTSHDTVTTYDADGNTETITVKDGSNAVISSTTEKWNIDGTLAKVATTVGSTTTTTDYAYDADGNRVAQRTSGVTTSYLNDPSEAYDQVLEEYTTGGVRAATYVRGLDLLFEDRTGADKGSTGVSFYAVDGLGSTRALVKSDGSAVTDTYTYDAFGDLIGGSQVTTNPYQYAGQGKDATGLYYNDARYYDAAAGRFTSRDSLAANAAPGSFLGSYSYASNNPTNFIDPSGHLPVTALIGTQVHKYLADEWELNNSPLNPTEHFFANREIQVIAKGLLAPTVTRVQRRPDFVYAEDTTREGEVFELKHLDLAALAVASGLSGYLTAGIYFASQLSAQLQLNDYVNLLNTNIPTYNWTEGPVYPNTFFANSGVPFLPGSGVPIATYPGYHGNPPGLVLTVFADPLADGVLFYDFVPDQNVVTAVLAGAFATAGAYVLFHAVQPLVAAVNGVNGIRISTSFAIIPIGPGLAVGG